MTRRTEYWWGEWCEGMPPEPARIGFEGDTPATIEEIGGYEQDLEARGVRLIERVLPAGRAAAVEALSDAMWRLLHDMGAEGTSVCHSAKASARIAYEPFRVDADGDEAPLDYPLGEAESTLEEIRERLRHEINRPMTVLPWSDEPVSPVIRIEGGEA